MCKRARRARERQQFARAKACSTFSHFPGTFMKKMKKKNTEKKRKKENIFLFLNEAKAINNCTG